MPGVHSANENAFHIFALANLIRSAHNGRRGTDVRAQNAGCGFSAMLTATDFWISWSIIGALVGAASYLARRPLTEALFSRMLDGILGACVGGEIIRRWDPAQALAAPGLLGAAIGSVLFLVLLSRFRPA